MKAGNVWIGGKKKLSIGDDYCQWLTMMMPIVMTVKKMDDVQIGNKKWRRLSVDYSAPQGASLTSSTEAFDAVQLIDIGLEK